VPPTRSIYDDLASLYAPIAVAVVVLVFLFTALALLRGTRRRAGDPVPAAGRSEDNRLEGAYVVLLCLVTAGLVVASFKSFDRLRAATASASSVRVDVDAAKWRWRFVYPATGASSIGLLVVPAGEDVRFVARSADVLHDFWVPDAKFQKQVWPDRTTAWTLKFPRGTYDGVCAWYCGLQHDRMVFTVRAVPRAEFRRWLAAQAGKVVVP
jgi:cytochrome c oxidase subunit 2